MKRLFDPHEFHLQHVFTYGLGIYTDKGLYNVSMFDDNIDLC